MNLKFNFHTLVVKFNLLRPVNYKMVYHIFMILKKVALNFVLHFQIFFQKKKSYHT